MKIKEIIVVEGRDDTASINRAVEAQTIETHGFGISRSTWELIAKAYEDPGIIIFTDPDFAGNKIRQRIKEKFPDAKEAFLAREDATKAGDIGIENAVPEAVREALSKAHCTLREGDGGAFSKADLVDAGLTGREDSMKRREEVGKILGIGGGNGGAFLKKLNSFGITKEEFYEAVHATDNK